MRWSLKSIEPNHIVRLRLKCVTHKDERAKVSNDSQFIHLTLCLADIPPPNDSISRTAPEEVSSGGVEDKACHRLGVAGELLVDGLLTPNPSHHPLDVVAHGVEEEGVLHAKRSAAAIFHLIAFFTATLEGSFGV